MKLILNSQRNQLLQNSRERATRVAQKLDSFDPFPVVKLFTPDAQATWLISEMDEEGRMFGLCDLGLGCPELGYVMLRELEQLRGPLGLGVERDILFKADKTLSAYVEEARQMGRIVA